MMKACVSVTRVGVLLLGLLAVPASAQYSRQWQSGTLGYNAWGASYGYDIDGDGVPNMWIRSAGQLAIYNASFTAYWTIAFPGYDYPMLATPRDVDGDGLIRPVQMDGDAAGEVVVSAYKTSPSIAGIVRVYDAVSHALEWQSSEIAGFSGTVSVDDVDGDGKHEIVLTRNDYSGSWGYVEVWGHTGAGIDAGSGFRLQSVVSVATPSVFAGSTDVRFELGGPASVRLTVADEAGRIVRTLADARLPAGRYQMSWDGRDDAGELAAAGAYFYRLEHDGEASSGRLVLVR
jgi:hypothetical protein